jgi:hypothetical protein
MILFQNPEHGCIFCKTVVSHASRENNFRTVIVFFGRFGVEVRMPACAAELSVLKLTELTNK